MKKSKFKQFQLAIKAAFPATIPVLAGFLFLGMAFGILMQSKGYGFWWAGLMSAVVYAGSMQFVAVGLIAESVSLLKIFLLTLMVNARHIFYGFSLLEKLKNVKKGKPYLIFALGDETFTLIYSQNAPKEVSPTMFYLAIAFLNHIYWVLGSIVGGIIGAQFTFDVSGIDFAMTALFVSIFVEQIRQKENRLPGVIGVVGSTICLLIFGRNNFILPSMVLLVFVLSVFSKQLQEQPKEETQ